MTENINEQKNSDLGNKLLEHIKKNDLSPKPKWHYILKNEVFWGLGVLSMIIGGLAFSTIIFTVANADIETIGFAGFNIFIFFLNWTPFLWLILFVAFIVVGYEIIKNTKKGYRYPFWSIVLVTFLLTFSIGYAVYANGYARVIDREFNGRLPFGGSMVDMKRNFWMNPHRGMMAGLVEDYATSSKIFIIRDFKQNKWTVTIENLKNPENTIFIENGEMIKVIGKIEPEFDGDYTDNSNSDKRSIRADFILPFEIKGDDDNDSDNFFFMMNGRGGGMMR